ncbi:shikimate dehydrogenase [Agathobaculum sp. Marseille-P7918]|uniref:shikimate dehydrogenase n=1 Tax=Agathobaculum sp. Marseille-P7918 TaxID=2479843 RepID=UPI000F643E7E|nr:shikimate dehydrogenase [Agathobaculum sp. Marseille-P7918]
MENRISGHTRLYCLIGSPVGHSGSPAMYNYSFERTGVDAAYLAFEIPLEQVEEGVAALKTLHVGGFNVTMPDKTAVAGIVDELSPAARLIGACNTVTVSEDGKLTGHNTDGIGFVQNLHENGVEVKGQKLVVLGAGGAATAICVQAALDGAAEIAIFNRRDEFYANGERTVEKLAQAVPGCKATITPLEDADALADAVRGCNILVNATKVGMKPLDDQTLVPASLLRSDLVVADTVYNPRETRMIQQAEAAGCKAAVGGIGMLLWQGVAAFKLFTGKDMPAQEVLEKFFS